MAEFEAMQERLRYMDQLEKEMAEQKVSSRCLKVYWGCGGVNHGGSSKTALAALLQTVLHQTQDALQDALAKLAELKDMVRCRCSFPP